MLETSGADITLTTLAKNKEARPAFASKIAKAVLNFQNQLLDRDANTGSLCQVWLPELSEDGDMVLRTKGLPFCVAGIGDLLALFRCISCRYCFGTDATKPELLGAPGRVFTTQEPEMSRNVQKYSKEVYLRASEAQQCRVHSTVVLPLFTAGDRGTSLGIIEVVQTRQDMSFADIVTHLAQALEECNLYTCEASYIKTKEMAQSSHEIKHAISGGLLRSISKSASITDRDDGEAEIDSSTGTSRMRPDGTSAPATAKSPAVRADSNGSLDPDHKNRSMEIIATRNASLAADLREALKQHSLKDSPPSKDTPLSEAVAIADADEEADEADDEDMDDETDEEKAKRKARGAGNPGKPGKKLRLEDLQSQFGVGLKEAANRLGICPTTLKRACRRHGIQRWPRRQLLKLSRAIDQINATGSLKNSDGATANAGQPAPTPDTRWTALAHLIPGISVQPQAGPTGGQRALPGLAPDQAPSAAPCIVEDQRTIHRCESTSQQKLEQPPLPAPMMSTPLDDMMPQHSPQNSRGSAHYNHQMARHLSAGHIPGMEGQLSQAHLPSHGSLQHMDGLAHHSGRLPEPVMGSHMGTHQYMPSMHNPGMGHSGMQSMYNSAPQAIPGHMHPHSRSYPVDLGMSHHPMMDQGYNSPHQHHSPLSAPVSSPLMHSSQQAVMHNSLAAQACNSSYGGPQYPHTYEHHIMMDPGWPGQQTARTGHMESALHGLQRGGPQNMDLLYPPVDDLDDDVGIVDAEVLELLLSRPN
ncbi:g2057 [Coccomyxa viridis]|uniref:G2057 protein n=1 Tax=Coccomyxa viridis TaxID=1274662 RepID=A0ABP1FJF8_9CHLO